MIQTNKINFYLIKEFLDVNDIFRAEVNDLPTIAINENSTLYYNQKFIKPTPWVKDFFNTEFLNQNNQHIFNSASSQAVLLRKININNRPVFFAICFGTGFHLLRKDAFEPRFGLICVLNIIDENSLRRIDKHDIAGTPKFTAEQLSKKGNQLDFGLDVELDILLGATGTLDKKKKKENRLRKIFGTTLSGKSNLNINAKFNIDNVDRLLRAAYAASRSKRYEQKGFEWIDKIEVIKKGTAKYVNLEERLNELLQQDDYQQKIWLSIPELIEWQDINGFYFEGKEDQLYEDITFDAFREYTDENIELNLLANTRVYARHADGSSDLHSWAVSECLYAEIEVDGETFILINSEWYKIKEDFMEITNSKYENILNNHTSNIQFKDYVDDDEDENGYNTNMAELIDNAVCMDAKNIMHGGRYSRVEFCDIFDVDERKLIHVKKYSGSSVLSHLFAQGYVSAQLLLSDSSFRTKVESKVREITTEDYSFDNDIDGYEVVFAIISKPGMTEIPLFSKVNLNNMFARIQSMRGFDASISFIPNHSSLVKDDH